MAEYIVSYNNFFISWHEAMSELTDEQYGRLTRALNNYCFFGELPELKGFEKQLFIAFKPSIDSAVSNKISGSKGGNMGRGGAPLGNNNASKEKQYPPIEKNNSNDKENDNVNDNVNVKEKEILPSPSASAEAKASFNDDDSELYQLVRDLFISNNKQFKETKKESEAIQQLILKAKTKHKDKIPKIFTYWIASFNKAKETDDFFKDKLLLPSVLIDYV